MMQKTAKETLRGGVIIDQINEDLEQADHNVKEVNIFIKKEFSKNKKLKTKSGGGKNKCRYKLLILAVLALVAIAAILFFILK